MSERVERLIFITFFMIEREIDAGLISRFDEVAQLVATLMFLVWVVKCGTFEELC